MLSGQANVHYSAKASLGTVKRLAAGSADDLAVAVAGPLLHSPRASCYRDHRHPHQWRNTSFFADQRKEGAVRVLVNSKIVIDAEQFRKSNPNYPRLFAQSSGTADDKFFGLVSATDEADSKRVKSIGVTGDDLCKNDLLICSPTVLAFSLSDKFWGKPLLV